MRRYTQTVIPLTAEDVGIVLQRVPIIFMVLNFCIVLATFVPFFVGLEWSYFWTVALVFIGIGLFINAVIFAWYLYVKKQLQGGGKIVVQGTITKRLDRTVDNVDGTFIFFGDDRFDVSLIDSAGMKEGDAVSLHYVRKKSGKRGILIFMEAQPK
jgi:membrane-bound ClpP family serine protease